MIEPGLSIVVPVYKSRETLPEFVRRVRAVMVSLAMPSELILVNDGSLDGSWEVIANLAANDKAIRGFNLSRNYGQHNAVICGIRAARYDKVATIDDDLQHPPEEIPRLLQEIESGADVVYGAPEEQQHGLWRDLASEITKIALKSAMRVEVARDVSAFRVFRTEIRSAFESYRSPFASVDVLLTWGAARFKAVRVRHEPRREGASNYTFRKLVTHALNMLTGFSTWPLQFASIMGFAFTLFGVGVLGWVLGRYFVYGRVVPGFAFLGCIVAIFSGAQLFAIGVIGEYLARMHFRMMGKPLYLIRTSTDPMEKRSDER